MSRSDGGFNQSVGQGVFRLTASSTGTTNKGSNYPRWYFNLLPSIIDVAESDRMR